MKKLSWKEKLKHNREKNKILFPIIMPWLITFICGQLFFILFNGILFDSLGLLFNIIMAIWFVFVYKKYKNLNIK